MDLSIRHPRFYATNFISNHIKKKYCEVFSKRILIIFAPEEAEIFKDYLFILARFSVRLHLFSDDFKRFFCFLTSNLLYILTKIKLEKSIFVSMSPENKFCMSWNKFHKNLVLYEICSKKSKIKDVYAAVTINCTAMEANTEIKRNIWNNSKLYLQ
jgi:hypothetical protein